MSKKRDAAKPNERLLALMQEPERVAVRGQPPEELLSRPVTPKALERTVEDVIVAKSENS
jgi:hypothetical protein